MKNITLILVIFVLSGCASISEGIATAYMNKKAEEDKRVCEVYGKQFEGLSAAFNNTRGLVKVLMVHGVGSHSPGYSTQFLEKLAAELDLPVKGSRHKQYRITLPLPEFVDKDLGKLRVSRLMSQDESRQLLFYELSWSSITAPEKATLNYDNSGEYSYRRAEINDMLKKFSNDTGPDPMIYLGDSREQILAAFRSSFCWMIAHNWDDLPAQMNQICDPLNDHALNNLNNDEFAIVSHSLGSRIVMDGMHSIVENLATIIATQAVSSGETHFMDAFKRKSIPLYMLSNQLPLLQMGRKEPKVTGNKAAYCTADGSHYEQRLLENTSIIAFSDPNDILSYAIPQEFEDLNIDSRLCAQVTNININVAEVVDVLGFGKFANPLKAHIGYDSDDRVVGLIAHGIGNNSTSELVQEKCKWVRLVD